VDSDQLMAMDSGFFIQIPLDKKTSKNNILNLKLPFLNYIPFQNIDLKTNFCELNAL